jgi:hypothetical protein
MTGAEFATMVRTLPTAEQRLIEAKLLELARKRLDEAPTPTYRGGRCELMDILDGDGA